MLSGLALLMFGDVMYVAYLNSFYTDVAALVFLVLSVTLALRVLRWKRRADLILLGAASVLLTTAKAQHAVLGFWLAGFFAILAWLAGIRPARWFAVALTVLSACWLAKSTPADYAERGCFSTIFHHVLPHAKNVDRTLAELGLDASYKPYIGMVSFSPGSPLDDPEFAAVFRSKVSYSSLAGHFLAHPRDAYVALRVSLDAAGRQRPPVGNFDPSAGLPPYAESRAFALWSDFKRFLLEGRGSRFFSCFIVTCVVLATLLIYLRHHLPVGGMYAGMILIGMAGTELLISSLGDAMEIQRHHLLFYALFDMLILATTGLIGMAISRSVSKSPRPRCQPGG